MNRRTLIFLLTFLVVGIGIGYVFSLSKISGLQSEVSSLRSEVSTLTTSYNNLSTTYDKLQENYNLLFNIYNELRTSYNILNTTYNELRANYSLSIEMGIRLVRIESNDMQPTLKIGDVVVVRKVSNVGDLDVGYTNGTIVAFWGDPIEKPGEIIVHRVMETKYWLEGGMWLLTTHGDNNPPSLLEEVSEEYLIGEVVAIISESS